MNERLLAIAHAAPGTLGIAVSDPTNDVHLSVRGTQSFPLAGTSRLALALAAYKLADARKLSLETVVPIGAGDIRRGHSPLADAYPQGGVSMPLWKLVRATVVDGDETASGLVLRAIGTPADVQSVLASLGLAGFTVRGSETERRGDDAGTPDGVAALLIGVANQKYLSVDSTTEFLLALEQARGGDAALRAGLPGTLPFAHAFGVSAAGDATGVANDAGLVTFSDRHRVAVVALLANATGDEASRAAVLASVAKAVNDAYTP